MEGGTPITDAPIDLATLPSYLDRIATPPHAIGNGSSGQADALETEFLGDLARLACRVMKADFVVSKRFDRNAEVCALDAVAASDRYESAGTDRVNQLAESAARSRRTEIDRMESSCLIATVSGNPSGGSTVLVTALDMGRSAIEPFVLTQQLITSAIGIWQARYAGQRASQQPQLQGWIEDLQESIENSDTFSQLSNSVVDAIAINLGAHQVALCTQRGDNLSRVKVEAVGGNGAVISDSLWQAAASETLVRATATRWPAEAAEEKVATIAHRTLAESALPQHQAISVPLLDENGQPFAVLAVVGAEDAQELRDLSHISDTVARRVRSWRRQHQPLTGRMTRSLSRIVKARWGFMTLTIAVAVVAMLPVPYRVSTSATVVPRIRSFVVAPYSGRLRKTNVRVGDLVSRGTRIAELDGRELRIDMASLLAERDRAAKKRDIERSSGNVAEEQLAEYELAGVNEQLKLTRHRLNNLTVVSPIDGVVLNGELEDVSGAPVETGQLLAEIAMLDQLWIELNVPEEELSEIRTGQPVRIAFDATAGSVINANIESISPGAEVRNGENVFVARLSVDNPDGLLRPGISGDAKIKSDDRPLVAVLLRQVWRRISRLWI